MKKYVVLLLTLFCFVLHSQTPEYKGVPKIETYQPTQYKNAGKIWQIKTSQSGVLFAAADRGLLEYDGKKWQLYRGSKGFTRSLFIENDSLLYTGSDVDFGVWKRDQFQKFHYKSLYPKKNKTVNEYEEFWGVYSNGNEKLFVSHENIYALRNDALKIISAPTKFFGSFQVGKKLYLADEKKGLFVLENDHLNLVANYPGNINIQIVGMYSVAGKTIFVTRNNGLYSIENAKLLPIDTSFSQTLENEKVFSFKNLGNGRLAFGTILNGLYIADEQGNIVHHINRNKGLLNNTLLDLHQDRLGNLWCSMDFGLSKIALNNNIGFLYDFSGDFGTGTSGLLSGNKFYLGTNQGLYTADWADLNNSESLNKFKIIPGSEGQVWSLATIQGEVLVGHDQGLYKVSEGKLSKIDDHRGVWTIKSLNNNFLLTGNYNGILLFKKNGNNWNFVKKLKGIGGSCNQIVVQRGNKIWANIPNYGIIRADLDKNLNVTKVKTFYVKDFVGSNFNLYLSGNSVNLQFNTNNYIYDENKDRFVWKNRVATSAVSTLANSNQRPVQISDNYLFYSVNNGFALEKLHPQPLAKKYNPILFRGMQVFNNSEKKSLSLNATIPYKFNNVRLTFVVPQTENVLYQYKFGKNGKWSDWSTNNQFEFLDLREGTYNFYIKSMVGSQENEVKNITFKISPPIYRTWYAYFIYFLLAGFIYYLSAQRERKILVNQRKELLRRQQNKLLKQKQKFERQQRIAEQEQLEKEKILLEQKVKDKTIELAVKAKEDDDKARLLISVKEKLVEAQNNPAQYKIRMKEVNRLLDEFLSIEDNTFEIQMDELHQEFFKNLQTAHPVLSVFDLRLCAYLKTGLNTHEIAEILNVLPSSLYVKRSRLRKKLDLSADDDLFQFLSKF